MIAIDTNVLLRYLLQDDAMQSKKAAALVTGPVPVLVETIRVLAGKRSGLTARPWLVL